MIFAHYLAAIVIVPVSDRTWAYSVPQYILTGSILLPALRRGWRMKA